MHVTPSARLQGGPNSLKKVINGQMDHTSMTMAQLDMALKTLPD